MKTFFIGMLFLTMLLNQSSFLHSQQSLPTLPTLTEIVAREVTGTFFNHTFAVNDPKLFVQLGAALSSSNDFGGVPGAENYDIFYSDPNGNLDPNGTCITIECRFLGSSGGGGCNIAHLELVFSNGFRISPNLLSNFYGAGTNYIVGSELNAVDCNPNTFTTMGNNSATPNTMFLSLTFDFSALISEVFITACQGDGTNYSSGGTIFNEQNPSGVGYIDNNDCYNSIEIVEMTFDPLNNANYNYDGCVGDNFSITFGNVTFDEQNPTGQAIVSSNIGCDTLYNVNLSFLPVPTEDYNYTGCSGDNYSITFGNVTFDEQNPTGQALVPGILGCDTLYTVNLSFVPLINANFSYTGCTGDNYAITFGNVTFDEQNPTGQALVPGILGCDTLYTVNLSFVPLINANFSYTGCTGDNYAITFGNVTFDEQNPTGQALVPGILGCDTLYTVSLSFVPLINANFSYTGCTGDNYAITFGNVTFDEQNPTGQALVPGILGCDTLYTVNLSFVPLINANFSYTGCTGDNYDITFGNVTFDEQNPVGQALVPGMLGCDTIYTVNLSFDNCADCEIYAPNIIALSSQSNNENFIALFNESCNFTDISLKIYNRWGNLVHRSNELTWDGYVNGLKSETDVYVYVITYNLDGRFYFKYGDIMVLK
jgi:CHU_C Type IX secretion signal domain